MKRTQERMQDIHLILPVEVVKELKIKVIELYGSEQGGVSKAVTEAIQLWLKQVDAPAKKM